MRRSLLEILLVIGIATFFLLPFVQLGSIEASPWVDGDSHRRAAVLAESLLEQALAGPFPDPILPTEFRPLSAANPSETSYEGRVEVQPHPHQDGLVVFRAIVRWGEFPWSRQVSLEAWRSRNQP